MSGWSLSSKKMSSVFRWNRSVHLASNPPPPKKNYLHEYVRFGIIESHSVHKKVKCLRENATKTAATLLKI